MRANMCPLRQMWWRMCKMRICYALVACAILAVIIVPLVMMNGDGGGGGGGGGGSGGQTVVIHQVGSRGLPTPALSGMVDQRFG